MKLRRFDINLSELGPDINCEPNNLTKYGDDVTNLDDRFLKAGFAVYGYTEADLPRYAACLVISNSRLITGTEIMIISLSGVPMFEIIRECKKEANTRTYTWSFIPIKQHDCFGSPIEPDKYFEDVVEKVVRFENKGYNEG